MADFVYYIDYDSRENRRLYSKLYNRIFFKYELIRLDKNKNIIRINNDTIDKKISKKIHKCLNNGNNRLICSNRIILKEDFEEYSCFDGKIVLKNMVLNVIEHIENIVDTDFRNESIYVAIDNDNEREIILDLGRKFKNINIVTDKIKKMKRLDNKLNREEKIVYSITNNRKKSLKRAKILINFDYDITFFEQFNMNRNCIIINLNTINLNMKNSFHGSIIEGIKINYNNKYDDFTNIENFDKTIIYESYIFNNKYNSAKNMIKEDHCIIEKLIGANSEIHSEELKNNFTKSILKLDKSVKKD